MSDDTLEPNEEPDIELDDDLDDLEIELEIDDDDVVPPEGDEDDDANEIEVPSGVKIASEDEDEDEDETEGDVAEKVLISAEGDRILSKQEDEVLCTGCFLLVKASQFDYRGGAAACPHCGTPIGS